ncbi:hypothetical protein KAZ01_01570 [Candidatus Gracilibacteria bacterium]|nr:hypothetical protein [Candidatus Gracilibacteria bacterium]
MKNKNLFLLGIGYLAGMTIFMKFNKKTHEEIEKEIKKAENPFNIFVENFIQIHKDFFDFLKNQLASKENIKLFNKYKTNLIKEVDKFKKDAEKKIEELKKMGINKKDELEKELEKIYEKRVEYFDEFMGWGEDQIIEGKKLLQKAFQDLKKKVK